MMTDSSDPTQRKQSKAQAKQALKARLNEGRSASMIAMDKMTTDQLWAQWEKDAREMQLTPREEWQIDMNIKLLAELRETDPTILHAIYGEVKFASPEVIKKLQDLFENSPKKRKSAKKKVGP